MDKRHLTLLPTLAIPALLLSGCKQETYPFGNLNCQLETETPKICPDVPTLETGKLEVSSRGRFKLSGHYNACFHIEDVNISGKTKLHTLHNGYALELLGTQFEKTGGSLDKFPKTIGLINLNKENMKGRFVDFWAIIRGHGKNKPEAIVSHLQCESDG